MTDLMTSFAALLPVTLVQSFIVAFVVMAIMLPFRMLNFPDLTSEGAYPLGGAVTGALIVAGFDPLLALAVAVCCGFLAGCSTALIHLRLNINTLLAGILVMTMLYSINLRIMSRTNLPLFTYDSIFTVLAGNFSGSPYAKIAILGALLAILWLALHYFFNTEQGVAMRAVGANPDMAEAQGINVSTVTVLGVGAAGAMSTLAGGLMAQSQGFADVNMGFGILISGLAALIIGEAIVGRRRVYQQISAPLVGAVAYYMLISFCLTLGLAPSDLKLATGLFVLIMLALPKLRGRQGPAIVREKIRE